MSGYCDWIKDNEKEILKGNGYELAHTWEISERDYEASLSPNTQHIMLLTTDEASSILDEIYNNGTTYAGNIKDFVSGTKNIFKLMSYRNAGKLVFALKGLGIKAVPYIYQGITYIKITGYPSLRRILNGTRYAAMNPKILELGISKAGINAGIMGGARFCIYFAGAQRVIEFVFSSEHDLATFIGNLTMDVAKVIVTVFLTKLAVAAAGWLVPAAVSATISVAAGIVLIIVLGFAITALLTYLDNRYHLSENLIKNINEGLKAHQKIMKWNFEHSNPYLFPTMIGYY